MSKKPWTQSRRLRFERVQAERAGRRRHRQEREATPTGCQCLACRLSTTEVTWHEAAPVLARAAGVSLRYMDPIGVRARPS